MLINTKFLGDIEIEKKEIICFEHGLPGFNTLRDFVLLPVVGNAALNYLQSMQETNVCFILMNPFLIIEDYEINISEETVTDLIIEKPEDISLYSILTITEKIIDITANLAAPIIINTTNNKAAQEILNDSKYAVKHKLYKKE
ncbi:MAG: flagellar assembly protein FliW [Anaerocolumna sp.]|nr:flagellar assembly protein FliW [Anaerocolumna sp.]